MISTCAQTNTRSRTSVSRCRRTGPRAHPRRVTRRPATRSCRGRSVTRARAAASSRSRDQREDEVRLAEMAALEARGRCTLRIAAAADHAASTTWRTRPQQGEPALVAEPGQRRLAGRPRRSSRSGSWGRGLEAPEDRGVDQPRHEALEQLALPENDLRLVADAPGQVVEALGGLAERRGRRAASPGVRTEPQTASAAASASAPSASAVSGGRALLSSSVIAGTISVRSPITRVVGARQDGRLGVGVDRKDLLRPLAAGDVLGGAADAAGDVEVGQTPSCRSAPPGRCGVASPRS